MTEYNYESSLDGISYQIGDDLMKYSRMSISQCKEKFDTVRVYCRFGWSTFYSFYRPNYHHYGNWPKWAITLDLKTMWIMNILSRIIYPWQKFVYRQVYKKYVRKYPELKENILCCADYSELLEGL